MRLYLICTSKPRHGYEVLSYDKHAGTAQLRSRDGEIYHDPHFDLTQLRRFYQLQDTPPAWWQENDDAIATGVQA